MRKMLDETFKANLALNATVTASNESSGHSASFVIDRKGDRYWTTDDGVDSAVLEFKLPKVASFDRAMLQENITVGQRVEVFRLESWQDNSWKEFATGTTIGYKRLLRFPVMTSQRIRVVIERSRTSPTLCGFGLYNSAPAVK
jgi:alpha-L-fucosidase